MLRHLSDLLVLTGCALLVAACGGVAGGATGPPTGKRLAVKFTDMKLNETHGYIPADVTGLKRRGSILSVSYTVLYCRKPDGVDVTYSRVGTTQIMSISALDPIDYKPTCSPPSSYPGTVEVPILRGASTFEFTQPPGGRGDTPPSSTTPTHMFESPIDGLAGRNRDR